MTKTARCLLTDLLLIVGLTSAPSDANAQSFGRPVISIIVPSVAGSVQNTAVRSMEKTLGSILGATIVVHAYPSATGQTSIRACQQAKPDGGTMCFVGYGAAVAVQSAYQIANEPYIGDGLVLIRVIADHSIEMVGRSSLASNLNLDRFVDESKKSKEAGKELACGFRGGYPQLAMHVLRRFAEMPVKVISYTDQNEVLLALERGELDCAVGLFSTVMKSSIDRGVSTHLGTFGTRMNPLLPNTRLLASLGCADCGLMNAAFAMWGPPGLPADIAERYNAAITKALQDEDVRKAFEKMGTALRPESTIEKGEREVTKARAEMRRLLCQARLKMVDLPNPFAACAAE